MNEIGQKLDDYYLQFLEALPRFALAILIFVVGILIANWITSIFRKKLQS